MAFSRKPDRENDKRSGPPARKNRSKPWLNQPGAGETSRPGFRQKPKRQPETEQRAELARPKRAKAFPPKEKRDQRSFEAKGDKPAPARPRFPKREFDSRPKPESQPPAAPAHGMPRLVVTFKDTRSARLRYTWIYDNMVVEEPAGELNGRAVAVHDQSGKFLGSAIYNKHSRIRARIFSLQARQFDDDHIRSAIAAAIQRRAALYEASDSCRLVYGDSDALPGLVVDRIAGILVVQLLTFAADLHDKLIISTLQEIEKPCGIIVRRDVNVREKEGLAISEPEIIGDVPQPVAVQQDGFITFADLLGGQKTGLFLDQRFNRRLIRPWCKDARVLDLYSYVGAWALTAANAGAREVIGVDVSAAATALATRAAQENGFQQLRFVTSDVFDYLDQAKGEQFDVVVCDPPAFAKTRAHVTDAVRAYLSLNYRCMKMLPVGGILATSSCSQHVGVEEFEAMLTTAARNARLQFQIIARSSQAPDHPALLGFPESEYLKCFILQRTE